MPLLLVIELQSSSVTKKKKSISANIRHSNDKSGLLFSYQFCCLHRLRLKRQIWTMWGETKILSDILCILNSTVIIKRNLSLFLWAVFLFILRRCPIIFHVMRVPISISMQQCALCMGSFLSINKYTNYTHTHTPYEHEAIYVAIRLSPFQRLRLFCLE